jgi:hypothetical protein
MANESVDILVFNMSVRLIFKLTNYNPPKLLAASLVCSLFRPAFHIQSQISISDLH